METKRIKKYFTVIPLQLRGELAKVKYNSVDNPVLEYGETRFPIIPVIANTAECNDVIKVGVVLICQDGKEREEIKQNYQFFKDELEGLKTSGKVKDYEIIEIKTEDDEKIETQVQLLKDMMAEIGDDENLYSCVTYGTKPTPVVMMLALNYGYKIKHNTTVENVVYGRYDHAKPENSALYDITALFYANSIINRLGDMKVENPDEALNNFLNF